MRAIIVAAVSTAAQATEEKGSIENQLALCREVCEARDWRVVHEIIIRGHSRNYEWLDEITEDCAEYKELVRLIRKRDSELVVVRDYDRLWRTDALRGQVTALCRQNRIQIYSVHEPLDLVDPEHAGKVSLGRMIMEGVTGIISQGENSKRVERAVQGKQDAVNDQGRYMSASVAYGYRRCGTGQIEPDPATAPVVRQMFDLRVRKRWGTKRISYWLNEQGVPTPQGSPRWSHVALNYMLANPLYIGHVQWGAAYTTDGQHEPIVTEETWQQAQAITRMRRRDSMANRQARDSLLRGMARCGHCGYAMVYRHYDSSTRRPTMLCGHYQRSGGRLCQSNGTGAWRVEEAVMAEVRRVLSDPEAWRECRGQRDEGQEATLAQLQQGMAECNQRWQRWERAYETGIISGDELLVHRARILGERARLERHIVEIETTLQHREMADAKWGEMSVALEALDSLPIEAQRQVLLCLIEEVRCRKGKAPEIVWL